MDKKKKIVLIVAVLVLVGLGVGAFFMLKKKSGADSASAASGSTGASPYEGKIITEPGYPAIYQVVGGKAVHIKTPAEFQQKLAASGQSAAISVTRAELVALQPDYLQAA